MRVMALRNAVAYLLHSHRLWRVEVSPSLDLPPGVVDAKPRHGAPWQGGRLVPFAAARGGTNVVRIKIRAKSSAARMRRLASSRQAPACGCPEHDSGPEAGVLIRRPRARCSPQRRLRCRARRTAAC